MSTIKLSRHGEIVRPEYVVKTGQPAPAGESTERDRTDGHVSGIVKRYRKRDKASDSTLAFNLIKSVFPASIEYTGIPSHMRGLIMLAAFTTTALLSFYVASIFQDTMRRSGKLLGYEKFNIYLAIVFVILALWSLIYGIRSEFFRPADEPIIFDRKNRKVYRLFRETYPGIRGLFRPWPMRAVEYDWNLIDVEHSAILTVNTALAQRHHSLLFIVRKSASDATIIDSFSVVKSIQLTESTVAPAWEHIRRFMEERGPHLPDNEPLNSPTPHQMLWREMVGPGPLGSKYLNWWKKPITTGFLHLISPAVFPIYFFWEAFNWLSYKTAFQVEWPAEVIDAVTRH